MTKLFVLFAAAALTLGACSTSNQVAQQTAHNDDVYFSELKATEQQEIVKTPQKQSPRNSDPYYNDYTYLNGMDRYYNFPYYSYITPYNRFDPWTNYYAYGYNNWYTPGISFSLGFSPWLYSNNYRYGYPYYGSYYGGPVLYNSYYPGYNYGTYNGGNINDPNYRARPALRGSENISGTVPGLSTVRRDAQGRVMSSPSRGEIYQQNNTGSAAPAPARTSSTGNNTARPARTQPNGNNQPQPQPQRYNPPQQAAPQPAEPRQQSAPASSGGGGGEDRARPSRVGN